VTAFTVVMVAAFVWLWIAFLVGDVTHHRLIALLEASDSLEELDKARTLIHYPFAYDFWPFPFWKRIAKLEASRQATLNGGAK
jgi:hypothetical protein